LVPDNIPIWIGADSGDGYTPLDQIFVCNAADAPLDGDCVTDWEIDYVDDLEHVPESKSGDEFLKVVLSDKTVEISGPIIVLGDRRSKQKVEDIKFKRENSKELKKKSLMEQKQRIEEAMRSIDHQLKSIE
jgi:hypothetical protein